MRLDLKVPVGGPISGGPNDSFSLRTPNRFASPLGCPTTRWSFAESSEASLSVAPTQPPLLPNPMFVMPRSHTGRLSERGSCIGRRSRKKLSFPHSLEPFRFSLRRLYDHLPGGPSSNIVVGVHLTSFITRPLPGDANILSIDTDNQRCKQGGHSFDIKSHAA